MVVIMNEAKSKKTASKVQKKENTRDNAMEKTEIERALERNDEEWLKRMLLLVLIMIIALLGLD